MTVRQLLAGLDSAELTEWMAYLECEREQQQQSELDAKLHQAFGGPGG